MARPSLALLALRIMSTKAAIRQASGTMQAPCPGAVLGQAVTALVLGHALPVLGDVAHGAATHECRAMHVARCGRDVGRIAVAELEVRMSRGCGCRLRAFRPVVEPSPAALSPPPGWSRRALARTFLGIGVGLAVVGIEAELSPLGCRRQLAARRVFVHRTGARESTQTPPVALETHGCRGQSLQLVHER